MRPQPAKMIEDRSIGAADVFERVGEDREAIGLKRASGQDALVVSGLSKQRDRRRQPCGVERYGAGRAAEYLTGEGARYMEIEVQPTRRTRAWHFECGKTDRGHRFGLERREIRIFMESCISHHLRSTLEIEELPTPDWHVVGVQGFDVVGCRVSVGEGFSQSDRGRNLAWGRPNELGAARPLLKVCLPEPPRATAGE